MHFWGRYTMVLDIRRDVLVVWEGRGSCWVLWMGKVVIPAKAFCQPIHFIAVRCNETSIEIQLFPHT